MKTYSELITIPSYVGRFNYLCLQDPVGIFNPKSNRQFFQNFYRSPEWLTARYFAITRDRGLDMAFPGYILSDVTVHHINPLTITIFEESPELALDPDNLISVSPQTHRAIHYGSERLLIDLPTIRRRGDTTLW